MRFSLALFPVAVALALASATAVTADEVHSDKKIMHGTAIEQSKNATESSGGLVGGIEKLFDDDGNEMQFMDAADDDEDEDEDDDDESQPQRRAKKHTKHHKIAAKKNKHKHHSKSKSNSSQPSGEQFSDPIQVTWYASHDLLAPACGTGDWNPTSSSSIGAVMAGWDNGPKCGEFVDICNEDGGRKCVTVRVIDQCGGCKANAVDLTKKAFKKLSPSGTLDEGRMHGLKMYHHKKPNPWAVNLFGPFKLQKTGGV